MIKQERFVSGDRILAYIFIGCFIVIGFIFSSQVFDNEGFYGLMLLVLGLPILWVIHRSEKNRTQDELSKLRGDKPEDAHLGQMGVFGGDRMRIPRKADELFWVYPDVEAYSKKLKEEQEKIKAEDKDKENSR